MGFWSKSKFVEEMRKKIFEAEEPPEKKVQTPNLISPSIQNPSRLLENQRNTSTGQGYISEERQNIIEATRASGEFGVNAVDRYYDENWDM